MFCEVDPWLVGSWAGEMRRDPKLRHSWVVLVDQNRDQLRRVQRVGVEVRIVLDIVHVLEYLWHDAYAFVAATTGEA